jgi:hypothetical protein
LACRIFQPANRSTEFVEAGERNVEVRLVEDFDPVDPVASNCQKLDHPPLGGEALG